jgi:predicted membrane chloride channel (bestrophin family)
MPLSYTRMTSRFIMLWLGLLPVALWGQLGWGSVPSETFIALCFLGIEEIGVQIEEPFSILALEAICESVQGNCIAMIEGESRDRQLVDLRGSNAPRETWF